MVYFFLFLAQILIFYGSIFATAVIPRKWMERTVSCFHESCIDNQFAALSKHLNNKPDDSLRQGTWFKLICGASNQDLPAIRDLTFVYTLAGADCIDVAADPGVISTARLAIEDAVAFAKNKYGLQIRKPWLMMSVNDHEDPHFRKARFDPARCPPDCPRPCEQICPANAIDGFVIEDKCYGCGRCLPVCPLGLIDAESYVLRPSQIRPLLSQVDCIEIHTQKGHLNYFEELWMEIGKQASASLKSIAVSFPDMGESTIDALKEMNQIMTERGSLPLKGLNIWQTDGRPMSGDIGKGTTLASVAFAKKVLESKVFPFNQGQHFVQLAGGTNAHTVSKVKQENIAIGGAAYGGYARTLVMGALAQLEEGDKQIEDNPEVLDKALNMACSLVHPFKDRSSQS